jgi:two-component system cell cycle sensor histidine kinase/response regulator CckA
MQRPIADASAPMDRTALNQPGGSVGLVILVALLLMLAAAGFLLAGRTHAQPYILAVLATLATVGIFLLFALAAGILRVARSKTASPLLKAVVDSAGDGILVTDREGRVAYSNAAYRALVATAESDEVRPVERVFIGDPGVSESVYRLMQAARQGRRSQEEVRVGAHKGEEGRWLRICVRPLDTGKRDGRMTVWSLADVTRELERHENVFQELQHAIDYLDHAPAGFFAADASGNIVYLNATLAAWLDHDLAQVGSGSLKLGDRGGAGRGTAHDSRGDPERGEDRDIRYRLEDPQRSYAARTPLPQGRLRRRRHAGNFKDPCSQSGAR